MGDYGCVIGICFVVFVCGYEDYVGVGEGLFDFFGVVFCSVMVYFGVGFCFEFVCEFVVYVEFDVGVVYE